MPQEYDVFLSYNRNDSGGIYLYEDVPPDVYEGLMEAESKGSYMLDNIIDAYPYRRVRR